MTLPNNAKKVFAGVMFDVYQWDQKQFDDSSKTFEAVKRKPSVQIIAVTKNKKIALLEEEQPHQGKFLSLPGGICEAERPEEDAKRELLEETGFVSDNVFLWKKTGFSAKVIWDNNYFIAKNCEKTSEVNFDSGEKIKVFLLGFDDFIKKVISDEFRNKEFSFMILKMIHEQKIAEFKDLLFS